MLDHLRRQITTDIEPLRSDEPVREGARRLAADRLTDLPVVGDDGRIVGIFGEKELIQAISPSYLMELPDTSFVSLDFEDLTTHAAEVADEPVSRFMRHEFTTLEPGFSALHCAELFLHRRQGAIPIVDDGKPIGVVRRTDFSQAIIDAADASGDPTEQG